MPKIDITGQRFGRLVAVQEEKRTRSGVFFRCRCDCGSIAVTTRSKLLNSHAKSCGCLQRDKATETGKRNSRHGCRNTPEYKAWSAFKNRCVNPNNPAYPNYGGRGIAVCQRWMESFEAFLIDMGKRWTPKHSIDRIDNDGPYAPWNCRWATSRQQSLNQRKKPARREHSSKNC